MVDSIEHAPAPVFKEQRNRNSFSSVDPPMGIQYFVLGGKDGKVEH